MIPTRSDFGLPAKIPGLGRLPKVGIMNREPAKAATLKIVVGHGGCETYCWRSQIRGWEERGMESIRADSKSRVGSCSPPHLRPMHEAASPPIASRQTVGLRKFM